MVARLLAAGTHPDLVALSFGLRKDGVTRSEIVVDQIRDLSQRLSMASQFGGWQVVTIDPADAMNAAAANALLKTLEEPTPSTLLALVADEPARLPATIRSRCQRIDFLVPSREAALEWLRAEGVQDAPAALEAAGGNPAWPAPGPRWRLKAARRGPPRPQGARRGAGRSHGSRQALAGGRSLALSLVRRPGRYRRTARTRVRQGRAAGQPAR